MSKVNAKFGWRPDKPDIRDHLFLPTPMALPESVDLRPGFPDCYDQGQLGSCTANAIAGALQFDQKKQAEAKPATPSRLFIYYNERVMEGTVSEDAGAEIRDGIKSVKNLGAPPETKWKYNIAKFASKPTKAAYTSAMLHQALSYKRLNNTSLTTLLNCLASGFPFVFGFTVYDYFESDAFSKDWILHKPAPSEGTLGGHAVVACGYDQAKKLMLVRNSWAKSWGIDGYFWMDYDYITNADLADDFWVIKQVE